MQINNCEYCHHWFRQWLATCSVPSLNQWWLFVDCIFRNKLKWNLDQNTKKKILKKIHLEMLSTNWWPFFLSRFSVLNTWKEVDVCEHSRAHVKMGGTKTAVLVFIMKNGMDMMWTKSHTSENWDMCYSDIIWVPWCLRSVATQLFVQQVV